MRKNKYSFTLTVVACCAGALIVVQFFWMRDALVLKNQQFDKNVQTALTSLAADFDDDIFCSELFTNIKFNAGEGLELVQRNWEERGGQRDWTPGPGKGLGFYYYDEGEELIAYDDLKFNYPATVQLVLKINTGFDTTKGRVFGANDYLELDGAQMPNSKSFKEFVLSGQDPAVLFSNDYIDSTLAYYLAANDIPTGFEYAVYNHRNEMVYPIDNPGLASRAQDFKMGVALLANNHFFDPYYLRVYFPHRGVLLFKRSMVLLLVSIGILLALIGSFWWFVRFLFRQSHLEQMKSNFVNNMTHEFKTPTTNISLAMENIEILNGDVSPRFKKYLRIINEENQRMIANVERILEVARYSQAAEVQLRKAQFDMHQVVKEVNERFALRVDKAGGSLTCKLGAQQALILGDRHHIKNSISNVLDNALKYCKETPNITLQTTDRDGFLEISVTDEGIGMDRKDIDRIFEAFYRKDTGNVHNVKGFGLGLSYVKRVFDMHGGKIEVESKLGKGTTFRLLLPVNTMVENQTT
jgi:two-component system phosphate regulon sensor histidine kinase PhoR